MNRQIKMLKGYEAPEAELFEVKTEKSFLESSFNVRGNNNGNLDDLGDTATDAGNAIWN